ncbi:DUF3276 family protein [Prolixibacteraceae bacterium JC049]|nr:DUF3276 family protein [Prolixibacteraceae bacterium JC049]
MDSTERRDGNDRNPNEEVFSKVVRAGKRTYFFDVKATRRGDYYLTITESKKRFDNDGRARYEKHKIFLYKEDFEKFADGLTESVGFIKENQAFEEFIHEEKQPEFSNVEFEDLSTQ